MVVLAVIKNAVVVNKYIKAIPPKKVGLLYVL